MVFTPSVSCHFEQAHICPDVEHVHQSVCGRAARSPSPASNHQPLLLFGWVAGKKELKIFQFLC